MKPWERVIEHHLRRLTNVSKNQFDFMLGRSTTEEIFLRRYLIERYREQKNLHIVFVDLENENDKITRKIIWWRARGLKRRKFQQNNFFIKIGLYQGSILSPYIFILMMNEVMRDIREEIS
jgi:Reverse transcriptase (RNA-dependent DNA polymerase)